MKICIIGGGTTGWWAAGYLNNKFPEYEITLIESNDIPIVGVGESTLPMVKTFFDSFGMQEEVWMPKCDAVYKYGNIKQGWNGKNDPEFAFTFWHNDDNAFGKWLKKYKAGEVDKDSLNDLYDKEGWSAVAYHLHAEEAGRIVKDHCIENVNHIVKTLNELPGGYDLYLDCTGFRRQFVKDKTESNISKHHLVNSAWVCPFELDEEIPYTRSIARDHGWQFKIGLTSRVGTGYVYSDKHISNEQALQDFKKFTSHMKPWMDKQPRNIKWKPNWLKNPWAGEVVAIGLSQGFIDPLESNALFMIQHSITTLAECLQRGYGAKTYNKMINRTWIENSAYILHHYGLSKRNDTSFWKEYTDLDMSETVWLNFKKSGNKYTNLYPDAIWAMLAVYYDNLDYANM